MRIGGPGDSTRATSWNGLHVHSSIREGAQLWDRERMGDLEVHECALQQQSGWGGGARSCGWGSGACFTEAGRGENSPDPQENPSRLSKRPRADISWGMAPSADSPGRPRETQGPQVKPMKRLFSSWLLAGHEFWNLLTSLANPPSSFLLRNYRECERPKKIHTSFSWKVCFVLF